jgi:hypothetical protein
VGRWRSAAARERGGGRQDSGARSSELGDACEMGNAAGGAVRHGMGWYGMDHGSLGGEWQEGGVDGW